MSDFPSVLASSRVFSGRVFDVRIDRLRYDDGSEHRIDVVQHGPSFTILATPSPDSVVMVRQYRRPAEAMLWELPAGRAEAGEEPLAGAARELREETGYRAGRMRALASLYTTPGFCDELMHFFHADQLELGAQALDEDERIEVRTFPLDAAWRLVAEGAIADCKTVLGLLWAQADFPGAVA
ncbi:MAG: NUDIX hydrolase [Acetobacteraceae bacterium]|nr:NUDIX hydrolase [Acetobacteraceae bacterium]